MNRLTPPSLSFLAPIQWLWGRLFSTWRGNYVIELGGWPIFNCLAWNLLPAQRVNRLLKSERKKSHSHTIRSWRFCWYWENASDFSFSFCFSQSFIFISSNGMKKLREKNMILNSVRSNCHEIVRAKKVSLRKNSDYIIFFSIETLFSLIRFLLCFFSISIRFSSLTFVFTDWIKLFVQNTQDFFSKLIAVGGKYWPAQQKTNRLCIVLQSDQSDACDAIRLCMFKGSREIKSLKLNWIFLHHFFFLHLPSLHQFIPFIFLFFCDLIYIRKIQFRTNQFVFVLNDREYTLIIFLCYFFSHPFKCTLSNWNESIIPNIIMYTIFCLVAKFCLNDSDCFGECVWVSCAFYRMQFYSLSIAFTWTDLVTK